MLRSMWVNRMTLDHLLDASVVAIKDILMRQLNEQAIDGAHAQYEQRLEYNRQSTWNKVIVKKNVFQQFQRHPGSPEKHGYGEESKSCRQRNVLRQGTLAMCIVLFANQWRNVISLRVNNLVVQIVVVQPLVVEMSFVNRTGMVRHAGKLKVDSEGI